MLDYRLVSPITLHNDSHGVSDNASSPECQNMYKNPYQIFLKNRLFARNICKLRERISLDKGIVCEMIQIIQVNKAIAVVTEGSCLLSEFPHRNSL